MSCNCFLNIYKTNTKAVQSSFPTIETAGTTLERTPAVLLNKRKRYETILFSARFFSVKRSKDHWIDHQDMTCLTWTVSNNRWNITQSRGLNNVRNAIQFFFKILLSKSKFNGKFFRYCENSFLWNMIVWKKRLKDQLQTCHKKPSRDERQKFEGKVKCRQTPIKSRNRSTGNTRNKRTQCERNAKKRKEKKKEEKRR